MQTTEVEAGWEKSPPPVSKCLHKGLTIDICEKILSLVHSVVELLFEVGPGLPVWLSGRVGRDQQVTLRRVRLILGWVTVFRQVHHLGM